jgi:hypothetical protein
MSANSAVTVLRSPSRDSGEGTSVVQIWGVSDFFSEGVAVFPKAAPQSSQNFADGKLSPPQLAQRLESRLPHSGQNFLPVVLSVPHLEQSIKTLKTSRDAQVSPLAARNNRGGVPQRRIQSRLDTPWPRLSRRDHGGWGWNGCDQATLRQVFT